MNPRDIAWWLRESAVRIGHVWFPANQVEEALGRYTKQLFCLTHHDQHPYAFLGSASAVRFRGRCFLVWCRHQTRDYRPDDVTIPIESGKTLISGSRYLQIELDEMNREEEYPDICAVEFVPQNYGSPTIENLFFPLNTVDVWAGSTDAQFYLYGYPTSLRRYEYEVPHVHLSQIVTSGRYDGASAALHLHRLRMTRTEQFPSDGLSGGPVYHLARDGGGFYAGMAGIILRGSETSDLIHFLDARFLMELLNRQIDGSTSHIILG